MLGAQTDVVIAASTAGGKTEAAFFPILTRAGHNPNKDTLQVLAISPLKALINDQHRRLEELAEAVGLQAHRWHGDVPGSQKHALLKHPNGVLYITPESLEALFVRHGTAIWHLLGGLEYIVVDELHAFIGNVRGRQLQSLLHRVEHVVNRTIPRIALSATLGDMNLAVEFLRPGRNFPCLSIVAEEHTTSLKLQVRGYVIRAPRTDHTENEVSSDSSGRSTRK